MQNSKVSTLLQTPQKHQERDTTFTRGRQKNSQPDRVSLYTNTQLNR